ncbi:MAG: glycerol-3-phosphate dehydrogenase subunit GlpB [Anaerolineae bacterium]|nr:glycerol-3-phosphate dehydrogenase subunit GlpB [Anaerolineae bacterium]
MLDLLVIGAGLAGLQAAITAAQAGARVRLIAKGLSATHWAAGTVDVLGYAPAAEGAAPALVQRPLDAIAGVPAPHPYSLLGREGVASALDSFVALTHELGVPYEGSANGGNLLLPSPVGAPRPAFLAPRAQRGGDLSRPEPMLIVGFQGMRDFYPELIAANLNKQGFAARAAFLPLSLLNSQHDRNSVQLAHGLDNPRVTAKLAAELKRLLKPGERIGLPAILGLANHLGVLDDLRTQTGAVIFEIPTLPPSVPGIRLHAALRKHVEALGVRVEIGMEGIGFHAEGDAEGDAGNIQWVETSTSARPLKHRAAKYLLATGGILGGGFNSNHLGRVWEVIFDLPLTVPQQRHQWFQSQFLDPQGHPVFRGGVAVNGDWQPLKGDGTPVYRNLWAAGGLLAGGDYIQERSLEGVAIASGRAAATRLLQAA